MRKFHILTILWLGILSSQLAYAVGCPIDSVITYDQNSNPIAKTIYQYDEAGRTIEEASYVFQTEIGWVGKSRITDEYFDNGKTKSHTQWEWSIDKKDWIGINKIKYTYNNKGLILTQETFNWGMDDWTNKSKYEYAYDSKNRQILSIYYTGNGTQWTLRTKQEYNYDANGNTILDCYYSDYDVAISQWIGSYKDIFAYDNKQLILVERYNWQNNDWYGISKNEYGYNAAGKQTLYINYIWNTTSSVFDKSTETYYNYDQWNNTILQEQYQWQGIQRIGVTKVRYEYTAYNSDPIMTATFQWDATQNIFIGVDSTRIAKDATDNLILDEQYTWSGNNWVGTKKEEYTYDVNKLVINTITYKWDVVKNTWDFSTKVLADYDNHKNQIKDERYQWAIDTSLPEGGYWKGTKYEVTNYNDKNVETDKITYQWDDTNRRWLGSSKSNYEFDAANHLILEEQYTWVLDPSLPMGGYWQGTKKEEFGYNAANQQIKAITYEWSSTINDWIGKTKVLSNFDSNKNQILNEQYTWTIDASPEGGYWHGTVKEEYTFNQNKQQISSLIYAWNDTNRSWDYVSKTKSDYDARKNLILDERYQWQNGEWVGTLKKEYAYNAQGQQTMFAFYAWDEATKTFVGTQKEETELDVEGRTILHATYTWETNNWIGKSKNEYTYTTTNQIATQIISLWSNNTWVYSTKTQNNYTDEVLTNYILYHWINNAWVAAQRWEQVDANTERTYEWWNNSWSVTQEKTKTYDDQNRLIRELDENYSHGIQTSGSKTEYTYTGDKLTQQSSFVYNEGWIETNRTTYTYSGNIVETISSMWTGSAWQGIEKSVQEYSNEHDYTLTQYEWRNGGWSGVSKMGYTFYPDGKEKSNLVYRWSGSSWVEDTKTEYEYSGEKNIVTAIYQWESGTWVGQSRIGNYYDEGEDLTTATWTWNGTGWTPNTKLGESHDADGNLTGQTTYSKAGDDFIYNTKVEHEYGATLKDKTTATYKWNITTNAWQGISKSGITYNGSKIASETTYTWISGLTWQPNQKKEYEYGVQAKDLTTAIYQWNATNSAWVGVSKSGVTYASNGKIASEFSYTWNGTDWAGVTKTEYEYGEGKNNSVATYKGDGTEWIGVVKTSEVYTTTGDSLGLYTYCWKEGAWVDSLKQEYTYNEYGDNILFIDATWNGTAWSNTDKSNKWEIDYYDYEKGLIALDAHYIWSNTNWIGSGSKHEYKYSLSDSLILHVQYTWSRGAWTNKAKWEWEYDQYGNNILKTYYTWDTTKRKWIGSYKYEYSFNADGAQTMNASYSWDKSKWNWRGITKMSYLYNDEGEQTALCSYKWNTIKWEWEEKNLTQTTYDEFGNLISMLEQDYNTSTKSWQNNTIYEYLYDSKGILIVSNRSTWNMNTNNWILRSTEQTIYDDNSDNKLREQFSATYSETAETQTYKSETYYYHCDPKYTITVQTENEGEGEVTGGGVYTYYARPQISAIEDPNCYTFSHWDDGDTNATRTVVVTENKTYTAIFTPIDHPVHASVKGGQGGSVAIIINE